ncbi:MAG TPA: DUF1778 domain-containing protein [Chloroflexota bacterium]|nr:DUF1778 domain-containing protein [Chloroflexota bacterium]
MASATSRLGFRINDRIKARIEKAAALEGRKVTDYCVTALAEAARQTIERERTLEFSERDWEIIVQVLTEPQEPNERLKRAHAEAQRRLGG